MVDLSSLAWATTNQTTGKSDQLFFQVTLELFSSVAQVIEVFLNLTQGVAQWLSYDTRMNLTIMSRIQIRTINIKLQHGCHFLPLSINL